MKKFLLLMILLLVACNPKPPTKEQQKQAAYEDCVDECRKYLDSVWIKGLNSNITDPKSLVRCLNKCEEKL